MSEHLELEDFTLTDNKRVSGESLENFFEKSQKLKKFNLRGTELMKQPDRPIMKKLNKNINEISFKLCNFFNDKNFLDSETVFENLTVLDLQNCVNVSDEAFKFLLTLVPNLVELDLRECVGIGVSLQMLPIYCSKLKILELRNCKFLDGNFFFLFILSIFFFFYFFLFIYFLFIFYFYLFLFIYFFI